MSEHSVCMQWMITHVFKLAFAELHGEVDHERSSNGKVEQSEYSVQPQHWRTEGERERLQLRYSITRMVAHRYILSGINYLQFADPLFCLQRIDIS